MSAVAFGLHNSRDEGVVGGTMWLHVWSLTRQETFVVAKDNKAILNNI